MGLYGNEIVDKLAKEDCGLLTPSSCTLIFLELYYVKKLQIMVCLLSTTYHHRYLGRKPGWVLTFECDRGSQTAVSRVPSGHIKCIVFQRMNENLRRMHHVQRSSSFFRVHFGLFRTL